MAGKADNTNQLEEHRRKLFVQNLNLRTTESSLREHFLDYDLSKCEVRTEPNNSRGHGFVVFDKESSVNRIMSRRPHTIDGQEVELYRSIPDQGPLKETKAITKLIVSNFPKGAINESDFRRYFNRYGDVKSVEIINEGDAYAIEFDDYDSVDQALLDRPCKIKQMELQLAKASRLKSINTARSTENVPLLPRATGSGVVRSLSTMKLEQTGFSNDLSGPESVQSVTVKRPRKIYGVHIKNIPPNVDGQTLATKFVWPLGQILINSSPAGQSSSIECWLKQMKDRQAATDFVQKWNGLFFLGLRIDCKVVEDRLDLCKKFQAGLCPMSTDRCDYEHVKCIANGTCRENCPYGHDKRVKTATPKHLNIPPRIYFKALNPNKPYFRITKYQLKITGFPKEKPVSELALPLHEKENFICRSSNNVVWIKPVRSMKHGRCLIDKCCKSPLDRLRLECQIEKYSKSLASSSNSNLSSVIDDRSSSNDVDEDNDVSDADENDDASDVDEEFHIPKVDQPRVVDDPDSNDGANLFNRYMKVIERQKIIDDKNKATSADSVSPIFPRTGRPVNENSPSSTIRTTRLFANKSDHGSRISLVEYERTAKEQYHRELNALELLKNIKGVVQLFPLREGRDNIDPRDLPRNKLFFATTMLSGVSLKEFVQKQLHNGLGVIEAVQLVQSLTKIVKEVHSRDVFHQNLTPETVMIDWNHSQSSADQALLTLVDFSQACVKSNEKSSLNQLSESRWYKAPQANVELQRYRPTIDTSNICALLLWLLTKCDLKHERNKLPHQQHDAKDELNRKIAQAVRIANKHARQSLEEEQLKNYLLDTLDRAFGYPQYPLWSIDDLECRLESIRELLLPRDSKFDTIGSIFKDLVSNYDSTGKASSIVTSNSDDLLQQAAHAVQMGKRSLESLNNVNELYTWSEGNCIWSNEIQSEINEYRHDDILTYEYRDGRTYRSLSLIITCIALLIDEEDSVILSISTTVNGKTFRIPIGRSTSTRIFETVVKENFPIEMHNLIKSVAKERRAMD